MGAAYHSGNSLLYEDLNAYGGGFGSQQATLWPPVAWLVKDYELTAATCPVLVFFCLASLATFLLQTTLGRCVPFQRFIIFYPPTLKAGEVWRLLTHTLLHSDLSHLLMNMLHILNTLDIEAVVPGSGYPEAYALGSHHVACAAALAASYGALVGSIRSFGGMFEGASAVCFGLDGVLFTSCGLLLGAGGQAELQSFLQVRGAYAVFHMLIDLIRGCGGPGTVGHIAHLGGFLGGVCYVLFVQPPIGGQAVPTVPCLYRSSGLWQEDRCLAFFSPAYTIPVSNVQTYAAAILAAGAGAALFNAFVVNRAAHPSADGYSVFVKAPGGRGGGDRDLEEAYARSIQTLRDEQRLRR